MDRPKLKLIGGIVLLAVLGLLYGGFLLWTNSVVNGTYTLEDQAAKLEAISSSVGGIRDLKNYVETRELEKFTMKAALAAAAAEGLIKNDWDGKSVNYDNGVIVTVSGDKILYPEDYPEDMKIDAASLTGLVGMVSVDAQQEKDTDAADDAWLVEYYRIKSDVYYLESERRSALEEKARLSYDADSGIKGIEDAFGIRVLLISQTEDEDGSHALLHGSVGLPEDIHTAEELGITKEMFAAVPEDTGALTAEKLWDTSCTVELEGSPYRVCMRTANGSALSEEKLYLVYMIPEEEFISMSVEQTVVILAGFVIIGIMLLVWFFSLVRLVRHYRLSEEQAQQLEFTKTARKAFSQLAIGCIVLFAAAALLLSLFRLFGVCSTVKKSLKVLEQRVEENKIQEETTVDELKNTYVSYAERIAGILKETPELASKEGLQAFSDLIEADYIMIFDHDGKEVVSSSDYVDMELGTSHDSSTYEFRRLLKGIPSVVHGVMTDEETGLTNAMIGVSLEDPDQPDRYRALLIAVPEDKLAADHLETMDDVMRSLVTDGTFAFSIDPESKTIVHASDADLIGRNAVSLELPEDALTDSYRDFFTIDNTVCYGESKDIDGLLYYYAAGQSHIYKNTLLYAGIAAAAGFLLLSVLIGYLLYGYRKGIEAWSSVGEGLVEETDDRRDNDDDSKQLEDPRKRWELSLSRYGLRTPTRNAFAALEILLVCLMIGIGIWYSFRGESLSGSLLGFVVHGQWTKGLNLFSFTSILILSAQVFIVVSILKILVHIISSPMGVRGETYRRLVLNLISYAGVIFFVYMALYKLGINLGALIASLSLPAFALSLGAKDLITDIVSGISIVFDGELKVGDYVEIGGYSGKVLEIGVRTTKLLGSGNNIKSIANRDVKNVINKSRKTSLYILEVKVSAYDYKLKEVEAMLFEQLPKLEGTIPGVTKGPWYWGVSAIGNGYATLSIQAECDEADYKNVKKEMNHAIQDLFDERGIEIS